MKKRSLYIIISVLILSLTMSIVDAIIKPNYLIKSIIKIILFLLIPIIYFILFKDEFKDFKKLFYPNKKDFLSSLLLGIFVYLIIIIGYFSLKNIIDLSAVTKSLTNNVGINSNNFIYVSLYISFINSLLEEFFFRGFAFITLKKQIDKKIAYIFSSLIFALYHVGMMIGWFHISVLILAIIGLFLGGYILNYLNDKYDNIYPSWLVHMFGNFAINTVGFILFGIL